MFSCSKKARPLGAGLSLEGEGRKIERLGDQHGSWRNDTALRAVVDYEIAPVFGLMNLKLIHPPISGEKS